MIRARALVDKMMRAMAEIVGVPGFSLHASNGPCLFRKALNGKGGKALPNNATAEQTKADDDRRRHDLTLLMEKKLKGVGGAQVLEKDRSPLQSALVSILESKEAMDALSENKHPIRLAGNYHAHELESMVQLQSQIEKDENYPLDPRCKKAVSIFAKFFIGLPKLIPPPLFAKPLKPSSAS